MDFITTTRRSAVMLLLAAMALRAVMPVGYMVGTLGGDLLFELCPEGMPSAMVQALGGEHHHGSSDDEASAVSIEQCPMGHLLMPVAFNASTSLSLVPQHTPAIIDFPRLVAIVATTSAYLSRAPPVLT